MCIVQFQGKRGEQQKFLKKPVKLNWKFCRGGVSIFFCIPCVFLDFWHFPRRVKLYWSQTNMIEVAYQNFRKLCAFHETDNNYSTQPSNDKKLWCVKSAAFPLFTGDSTCYTQKIYLCSAWEINHWICSNAQLIPNIASWKYYSKPITQLIDPSMSR